VPRTSSDPALLLSIDQLGAADVAELLEAARWFALQGRAKSPGRSFSVGLLFLASSLRTRVGFAEAAVRLGGIPITVSDLRSGPDMTDDESFTDTLRTVTGMVDVTVVRVPFLLDHTMVRSSCVSPLVNGGDGAEHPTQALIDVFAIEEERGPIANLRIALCGDLTMRAVRSLVKLLELMPPRSLTLVAPPGRDRPGGSLKEPLASRTTAAVALDRLGNVDVLYMAGLPAGRAENLLDRRARAPFVLTDTVVAKLPHDAIVLSPMPVIDEISPGARHDPRIRMFAQNDRGIAVRMAVLAWAMKLGVNGRE